MVAQQIANDDKIKWARDDPRWTYWVLLIMRQDYNFDRLLKEKCVYYEFDLPHGFLCIQALSFYQDTDEKIDDANYVRHHLYQ